MKNLLLLLFCFTSASGWTQSSRDSVLSEIKNLKKTHSELTNKFSQLKDALSEKDSIGKNLRDNFDRLLGKLDSLVGDQNRLKKKNVRTAAEQKRLTHINKRVDEIKTVLIDLAPTLETNEADKRYMSGEIERNEKLILQVEQKIKQLEKQIEPVNTST